MKLVRLFYASKVADNFDTSELDSILSDARERNTRESITGVLFFTTSHFIQCIEGDRESVNRLYNDMMVDARHTDLALLTCGEIDERMFPSWQMAYIAPDDIKLEILNKHSSTPEFDPYSITESMAAAMLLLLVKHMESNQEQ